MNSPNRRWSEQLAKMMVSALIEFRDEVADQVEVFAVDCHPWNGTLNLAILTHSEVVNDPLLSNPAEMAAWKNYHFGSHLAAWQHAGELAAEMRESYNRSGEQRGEVAEEYLRACATSASSAPVRQALSDYDLTATFRISVCHPDTEKEYCS